MKKTILALGLFAFVGLTSCGEAKPEVDANLLEATIKTQEEVDALNAEIEDLEETNIELDELENELDNI